MADDSWREKAACRAYDAALWFPEEPEVVRGEPRKRETPRIYKEAKKICMGCPVQEACLAYALDTKACCGMWGGLTRPERASILRERRKQAREALLHD